MSGNLLYKKLIITFATLAVIVFILVGIAKELTWHSLEKEIASNDPEATQALEAHRFSQNITLGKILNDRNAYVVIDVREPEEYAQGHIRDSIHARLGDIISSDDVRSEILKMVNGRSVVFFCHDGERSRLAAVAMWPQYQKTMYIVENGFDELRSKEADVSGIWDGVTHRVLPEGFWDELKGRGYKISDISDISDRYVVDVSLTSHEHEPVFAGKTVRHAPMMTLSAPASEELVRELTGKTFSVVCDSKVSCFYAKILAYRAERAGSRFSGYFYWD